MANTQASSERLESAPLPRDEGPPPADGSGLTQPPANAAGVDPAVERYLILLPVYNDWPAVTLLIQKLDQVLAEHGTAAEVLIVDDGSTQRPAEHFQCPALSHLTQVRVLQLRRNLHHQRAIAVGLAWAAEHFDGAGVILMDADGEDDPAWTPTLIDASREEGHRRVIFAARARRSESAFFVACYRLYQFVHRALTGYLVQVGNFSLVPRDCLLRLAVVSELWNHYAAAVYGARIARKLVPTPRAKRLTGESTMNFTGLVIHGLSAMSVFGPVIGVRLLVALAVLSSVLGIATVGLGGGAMLGLAAVEWALATGLMLGQTLLAGLLVTCYLLAILSVRHAAAFVPLRDYHLFVDRIYEAGRKV